MVELVLSILAGSLALAGIVAIVCAALARSSGVNTVALRAAQITLTLSGLLLFVSAFTGSEMMNLFGGLMLVVFGTGMTAIIRRPDRAA